LLHDAQRGHEWTITERGRPIARIVPIDAASESLEERLLRLERNGVIEPASSQGRMLPPPLPLQRGLARRMLDEDRGA
jgi:prevent-host-death family protein